MSLEEQIATILTDNLPGATVEIRREPENGKIGGHVILDGFAGYTSLKRQNRIFGILRRHLSPVQAQEISFIFSYTTDEHADLLAA